MRLIVSPDARRDLRSIVHYSDREWGLQQRKQYLAMLRARFANLRRRPELGAPRNDLAAGLRSLTVGSHIIFYRVAEDALLILRILHQRMDVRLHL